MTKPRPVAGAWSFARWVPSGGARPVAGTATLERATFVLAHAAPDAGVLTGLEGPGQAAVDDLAASTDGASLLDLQ